MSATDNSKGRKRETYTNTFLFLLPADTNVNSTPVDLVEPRKRQKIISCVSPSGQHGGVRYKGHPVHCGGRVQWS